MTDEIKEIRKTVDAYFNAVENRDFKEILESWHPEARMSFMRDGEAQSVPRSFWKDYCKRPKDPEEQIECRLVSLDMTGDVASVKTKITRKTPEKTIEFTDYLTLLRQSDGTWLIISKSYHTDEIPLISS
ncbi:MAG: nuclear transport factor 2 family protein [Candidatus Thorarchaeota archaeon]|jgi:ketosteroid isomerase-like protein